MPCSGYKCGKPLSLSLTSHGITYGFCADHLATAQTFIQRGGALTSAAHIEDYVKLKALVQCDELFFKLMKKFTNEVSRAEKKRLGKWRTSSDKVSIHLSDSLRSYEGMCWFGTQPKIMSGLLTAEEFQNSVRNGYMVKDPGPGPDHGEFSHRLQWHLIMRVVTNGFQVARTADWRLTPLELYCGMGEEGYARNVWGALLEGNGDSQACPGSPNWVNERFHAGGELGNTSFGNTIYKRFEKRAGLVATVTGHMQESVRGGAGFTVHEIATRPATATSANVHKVVECLYKWKKVGAPGWVTRADGTAPATAAHEEGLAAEMWREGIGHTTRPELQHYSRATKSDGALSEGLLVHGAESTVTDAPLTTRLPASRVGLNPAYKFGSTRGAKLR